MKNFWYTKKLPCSFIEALDEVEFALLEEWFWILNRIDLQQTLKKKLNKEIDEYIVLWACNPSIASDALENEYEIGLLLPCNVIVYKKEWNIFVSALMPTTIMGVTNNDYIKNIAEEVEKKLKKAIDSLFVK